MQKIVIAQGGGPTAVINQSLVGIIEAARENGVRRIWGARHGIRGILGDEYVPLEDKPPEVLNMLGDTPGSALGSTREKPDGRGCADILRNLRREGAEAFFYIGGNDTSATLSILGKAAEKVKNPLRFIHVPKTIDNDLVKNDHTPGYASAALYVARAFAGLNYDQKSLPGIHIGVVMGRHAGFLTAAAAAFRRRPDDGPHLVLVPEARLKMQTLVGKIRACMGLHGRCLIAVSEGITDEDGKLFAAGDYKDPHGNVQLSGSGALADRLAAAIQRTLGAGRVRGDTLGYMQRSFLGCVSPVDKREAREIGRFAFIHALQRHENFSVTIERRGRLSSFATASLEEVGGKTRYLPKKFYDEEAMQPSETFRKWLLPLLGESPQLLDLA